MEEKELSDIVNNSLPKAGFRTKLSKGLLYTIIGLTGIGVALGFTGCPSPTGGNGGGGGGNILYSVDVSPKSGRPGTDVTFTADGEIETADVINLDPDGAAGPIPVVNIPINPGDTTKTHVETFNNDGTWTPEAYLDSDPTVVYGDDITITGLYGPASGINTSNLGIMSGGVTGSFYTPGDHDAESYKVFASYFDHDLESLIAAGDAAEEDEVDVTGSGPYYFNVDGFDPYSELFLYFVPMNNEPTPEPVYSEGAKVAVLTSGNPEIGHIINVSLTGPNAPAAGTPVEFRDKYDDARYSTTVTAAQKVQGIAQQLPDGMELHMYFGGVDSGTMIYDDMGTYNPTVDFP